MASNQARNANGTSGVQNLLDKIKRYMDLAVDDRRSNRGQWQLYESFAVVLIELYTLLPLTTNQFEDREFYKELHFLISEYPDFHDFQEKVKTLFPTEPVIRNTPGSFGGELVD